MTKRLLGILLLLLYLAPAIGISGSVHYCGGEVAAVVIIPTDEHPCSCSPDEPMDSGCCQDKDFLLKIKDNHKNGDVNVLINNIIDFDFIAKPVVYNNWVSPITHKKEHFRIKEAEPPDIKLFILHESYLI